MAVLPFVFAELLSESQRVDGHEMKEELNDGYVGEGRCEG